MKLVGLIGHAGAGKNSFAEEFHYYNFKEYSFAAPLKAACCALFGLAPEHFTDRGYKETEHPFWEVSPRSIAQFVGTELVRNEMAKLLGTSGDDFWIRRLELQLMLDHQERSQVQAVITDCRFPNEVDYVLNSGGHIFHLTRPEFNGTVGIPSHQSEYLAANFSTYYPESDRVHKIENSGSLEELRLKAKSSILSLQF